ncbi:MAG: CoA pyrophosphatase [Magnetococcales bacterium]|nr:CoA pyrophosphatase [Magnetococcales bacterium]
MQPSNMGIMVIALNVTNQNLDKQLYLAKISRQQIDRCLSLLQESSKTGSNTANETVLDSNKTPRPSAVLLPLLQRADGWHILFIRRSQAVSSHKGQIAFPGGCWEDTDESLLQTALRETREELGDTIRPIHMLGSLPSVTTHSTGFIIYPFVGILEEPLNLVPDSREVAEVLTLPLTVFINPSAYDPVEYDVGEINVWGATARITHQFLTCLH